MTPAAESKLSPMGLLAKREHFKSCTRQCTLWFVDAMAHADMRRGPCHNAPVCLWRHLLEPMPISIPMASWLHSSRAASTLSDMMARWC